jgi:7-cyano-7-deazaguanine synthase
MTQLLLLSGGLDSTCLGVLERPAAALVIDYGQIPAAAEFRAADYVANKYGIRLIKLVVDCSGIGQGLLADGLSAPGAPSPEWWPFRNQLLATLAASVAIKEGLGEVAVATVASDGERHVDGTAEFYFALAELIAMQEGGIRLCTPCIDRSTQELFASVDLPDDVLVMSHSCHVASLACGWCPGCLKRQEVLRDAGRLQPTDLGDG